MKVEPHAEMKQRPGHLWLKRITSQLLLIVWVWFGSGAMISGQSGNLNDQDDVWRLADTWLTIEHDVDHNLPFGPLPKDAENTDEEEEKESDDDWKSLDSASHAAQSFASGLSDSSSGFLRFHLHSLPLFILYHSWKFDLI